MTEYKKTPQDLTIAQRIGKKVVYQVKRTAKPAGATPTSLKKSKAGNPTTESAAKTKAVKVSEAPAVQPAPQVIATLRQQKAQTMIAWLVKQYPACFNIQAKKPLKKGIHKELRALHTDVSRRSLAHALTAYTRTPDYYEAVLNQPHRYDLVGQVCADITETEKAHAQAMLIKLQLADVK